VIAYIILNGTYFCEFSPILGIAVKDERAVECVAVGVEMHSGGCGSGGTIDLEKFTFPFSFDFFVLFFIRLFDRT
jgi:hypothetical protein